MSWCDKTGAQLDAGAVTIGSEQPEDAEAIVVHYGDATARTTIGEAARRLGLTPDEYRRDIAALVDLGHLVPRLPGEYDAQALA